MSKKIIVIHGLAAKPEEGKLKKRYEKYLSESTGLNIDIDLVYWADLVNHEVVIDTEDEYEEFSANEEDPNFREFDFVSREVRRIIVELTKPNPREVKNPTEEALNVAQKILEQRNEIRNLVGLPQTDKVPGIDSLYEAFFADVRKYFRQKNGNDDPYRELVRNRLTEKVEENTRTCLIAHSMGSIIALDAILKQEIKVDLFLTIGSPLGISIVQRELGVQRDPSTNITKVPNVREWFNYYDPQDPIAVERFLSNDYSANGNAVTDIHIDNDFVSKTRRYPVVGIKRRNYHKSYGYLKDMQLAQKVKEFLEDN